jgi:TPR repeat protein
VNERASIATDLLDRANQAMAARRPHVYVRLLKLAARLGNPEAKENLAGWYLEGMKDRAGHVVLPRSPKHAVVLLKAAAEAHNPLAQFALAYCYDVGTGVRQDLSAAAGWYRKAANRGVSFAAANLAVIFRQRGDVRGERRWLARAARLGDADARIQLACLTLRGRAPPRMKHRAIRALRRLAETDAPDSAEAMLALADAYTHGLGVEQSESLSGKWRRRASRLAASHSAKSHPRRPR